MAENINPMTNECDCVDCHALRYDIAVDAVRDAKVLLADAFIDCDAALEALIASPDANALAEYMAAMDRRNALVTKVKFRQALANKALDALIARKHAANGERNG